MVAVLYPGKSDALRGLILAGLGMAGTAGEPMDGMQTVIIKDFGAVAYGGATVRLYVDGKPDGESPWTGGIAKNDAEVLIGENVEQANRCFDGLIDDVRIYNCALSESEIKALAAGQ